MTVPYWDDAEHGRETGRIVMSPDGGYHEVREPVPAGRATARSARESSRGS